jgi:hypothetical protein
MQAFDEQHTHDHDGEESQNSEYKDNVHGSSLTL